MRYIVYTGPCLVMYVTRCTTRLHRADNINASRNSTSLDRRNALLGLTDGQAVKD